MTILPGARQDHRRYAAQIGIRCIQELLVLRREAAERQRAMAGSVRIEGNHTVPPIERPRRAVAPAQCRVGRAERPITGGGKETTERGIVHHAGTGPGRCLRGWAARLHTVLEMDVDPFATQHVEHMLPPVRRLMVVRWPW